MIVFNSNYYELFFFWGGGETCNHNVHSNLRRYMLTGKCTNAETLDLYSVLVDQMLVHFYSEKMLFFRYCVREALNSIRGKVWYPFL